MTNERFQQILNWRLENIKSVLKSKAKEYAKDDRLHNFKVAARIMDATPLEAAYGMCMKHFVCISDMVEGKSEITPYMVEEKFGDMINYLILMEAICIEQLDEREKLIV